MSINPGATTGNTSTITLTPYAGFTGSVALTAVITGSPDGVLTQSPPTLSFGTTSPVSITGASAGTATLTIATTAPTSAALPRPARQGLGWFEGGTALACLLFFGISAHRRRWRAVLSMIVFLAFLTGGVVSCSSGAGSASNAGAGSGGGGTAYPGTSGGTYFVTVTGTSGTQTVTGMVTITVQ